jgi:2-amino-4-hydroxy-6-hydroxymethyldihydropteridine diphosphokinase
MRGIYVLLGSNLGERVQHIRRATAAMEATGIRVLGCSDFFETAPWGITEQPAFINQAIAIDTALEPQRLLEKLKIIERETGREENIRWGPRKIDIDILLYHDQQIKTDELEIPHPRMTERRFTLLPLAQLAGSVVHPGNGYTISRLLADCPDDLPAHPYCARDFHHMTYVVKGKVQGVGFRRQMVRLAYEKGIRGFVQNLSDGSVEIQAEGSAEDMSLFLVELKKGAVRGQVNEIQQLEGEPNGYKDFTIRK